MAQGPSERKSYIICTTPRSGSNLLCDYLTHTEVLGRPTEFLNPELVLSGAFDRCFGKGPTVSVTEYVDWLFENMCSENRVFGIKIMYDQFVAYRGFPAFQQLFEESALFYLTRPTTLRQAISLHLARQTNLWTSEHVAAMAPDEVPYDYTAIDNAVELLIHQDIEWRVFLSSLDRPYCVIDYDRLVESPRGIIAQFGGILGVDVQSIAVETSLREQRTGATDRLLARYKEDLRAFYYGLTAEATYEGLLLKP